MFFIGYMSMQCGVDFYVVCDSNYVFELLQDVEKFFFEEKSFYGWGWFVVCWGVVFDVRLLDDVFLQRLVVVINDDKSYCWMNCVVVEFYGFIVEECSVEVRIVLLDEMLFDIVQLKKEMWVFMV